MSNIPIETLQKADKALGLVACAAMAAAYGDMGDANAVTGGGPGADFAGDPDRDVPVLWTYPLVWTGAVNSLWDVGGNWAGGVVPVTPSISSSSPRALARKLGPRSRRPRSLRSPRPVPPAAPKEDYRHTGAPHEQARAAQGYDHRRRRHR